MSTKSPKKNRSAPRTAGRSKANTSRKGASRSAASRKSAGRPYTNDYSKVLEFEFRCPLRFKERKALVKLGVRTIEDFLKADLSEVLELGGMGQGTYEALARKQAELEETRRENGSFMPPLAELPVSRFVSLTLKEAKTLRSLKVHTLGEFLYFDTRHVLRVRSVGTTTQESLLAKQESLFARFGQEVPPPVARSENGASELLREEFATKGATISRLRRLPLWCECDAGVLSPDDLHPSYRSEFPVTGLGLSQKGRLACETLSITTVGALLLTPYHRVVEVPTCGRKTVAKIRESLIAFLAPSSRARLDTRSYSAFIDSIFKPIVPEARRRKILCARAAGTLGPVPLGEVGAEFNLSRERIRQVEKSIKTRILNPVTELRLEPLRRILEDLLRDAGCVCPVTELGKSLSRRFHWKQAVPGAMATLFIEMLPGSFKLIADTWCVFADYHCAECDVLRRVVAECFSECCQPLRREIPLEFFRSKLSERMTVACRECSHYPATWSIPEEVVRILWVRYPECFKGFHLDGCTIVSNLARGRNDRFLSTLLTRILQEAGGPLSLKEIHRAVAVEQRDAGRKYDCERMRHTLNSMVEAGRGIMLWNRGGVYIHRDFVDTRAGILKKVEREILQRLSSNQSPQMSLYSLHEKYSVPCGEAGFPSVYALFSALKLRRHSRLSFLRAPYVTLSGSGIRRKSSVAKLLEDYIRQRGAEISRDELHEHASEFLGMAGRHLHNLIPQLKNVLKTDNGFLHVDNFGPDAGAIAKLTRRIRAILKKHPEASAEFLFRRTEESCLRLGIRGPLMLASVLQHFANDRIKTLPAVSARVATANDP